MIYHKNFRAILTMLKICERHRRSIQIPVSSASLYSGHPDGISGRSYISSDPALRRCSCSGLVPKVFSWPVCLVCSMACGYMRLAKVTQ